MISPIPPTNATPESKAPNANDLKAARDFEAIFLRKLLEPMQKMTGSTQPGNDNYGSMVTDSMADHLANAGGLGLAEMLAKEFARMRPEELSEASKQLQPSPGELISKSTNGPVATSDALTGTLNTGNNSFFSNPIRGSKGEFER